MTEHDDSLAGLPQLLTVEECAKWLRSSPATVRRYCRDGVLRGVKLGGSWRIPKEELLRLLKPVELAGGREFPKPAVSVGRPRLGEDASSIGDKSDDAPARETRSPGGRVLVMPRVIG